MTNSISRVGIYEPNPDGHRFKYVQYLVKYAEILGAEICVVTSKRGYDHPNYEVHLANLEGLFSLKVIEQNDRNIEKYSHILQTSLMVVPDGDKFIWKTAWRKSWKGHGEIVALAMRADGQGDTPLKRLAGTAVKRTLLKVGNSRRNVNIFELKSSLWEPRAHGPYVPDPITYEPDIASLTEVWPECEAKSDIKWVGLVGALTERKNINLVLKSALQVQHTNFGIILAGQMDPAIREDVDETVMLLRQKGVPVIALTQLLTDGQLDAVISKLHCVVLAHSNEGPSGILGKSVQAGTFVVAAGAKSLKRDCKKIKSTSCWSPLNGPDIARSIRIALGNEIVEAKNLDTEKFFASRLLQHKNDADSIC